MNTELLKEQLEKILRKLIVRADFSTLAEKLIENNVIVLPFKETGSYPVDEFINSNFGLIMKEQLEKVLRRLIVRADFATLAEKMLQNNVIVLPFKADNTETARNISELHPVDEFICSDCGLIMRDLTRIEIDEDDGDEIEYEFEFCYCPRCGRKIKED